MASKRQPATEPDEPQLHEETNGQGQDEALPDPGSGPEKTPKWVESPDEEIIMEECGLKVPERQWVALADIERISGAVGTRQTRLEALNKSKVKSICRTIQKNGTVSSPSVLALANGKFAVISGNHRHDGAVMMKLSRFLVYVFPANSSPKAIDFFAGTANTRNSDREPDESMKIKAMRFLKDYPNTSIDVVAARFQVPKAKLQDQKRIDATRELARAYIPVSQLGKLTPAHLLRLAVLTSELPVLAKVVPLVVQQDVTADGLGDLMADLKICTSEKEKVDKVAEFGVAVETTATIVRPADDEIRKVNPDEVRLWRKMQGLWAHLKRINAKTYVVEEGSLSKFQDLKKQIVVKLGVLFK